MPRMLLTIAGHGRASKVCGSGGEVLWAFVLTALVGAHSFGKASEEPSKNVSCVSATWGTRSQSVSAQCSARRPGRRWRTAIGSCPAKCLPAGPRVHGAVVHVCAGTRSTRPGSPCDANPIDGRRRHIRHHQPDEEQRFVAVSDMAQIHHGGGSGRRGGLDSC